MKLQGMVRAAAPGTTGTAPAETFVLTSPDIAPDRCVRVPEVAQDATTPPACKAVSAQAFAGAMRFVRSHR
jgi:hypothetical protein